MRGAYCFCWLVCSSAWGHSLYGQPTSDRALAEALQELSNIERTLDELKRRLTERTAELNLLRAEANALLEELTFSKGQLMEMKSSYSELQNNWNERERQFEELKRKLSSDEAVRSYLTGALITSVSINVFLAFLLFTR